MTAAWELSKVGVNAVIAEKSAFLGGRSAQFACKAIDRCLKCGNCLVEERLKQVMGSPLITTMTGAQPLSIEEKAGGGYLVSLKRAPQYIDPLKCTNCGLCFSKCPAVEEGAIAQAPSSKNHPFYAIDSQHCNFFKDKKARICEEVCPEGAINLAGQAEDVTLEVDGVVVATGFDPFDPRQKVRFNFDAYPNMITGLELERMLRDRGGAFRPSDGAQAGSIAFVQCVGSRDATIGRNYCSRVCCGYALRMGMRIGYETPDTKVTVFYMDIQNFGKDFDRFMSQARKQIRLVRSMPGDYYQGSEDRIAISYFDSDRRSTVQEEFDLVALSVGISPGCDNRDLSAVFGLELDDFGFIDGAKNPEATGVMSAGTATGPMSIPQSITSASRVAEQMARYLGVIS